MNLTNKRFKSRGMRVLFHVIPRRMKRLVFIASLSGKLSGTKELDRSSCIRITKEFQLCRDPDAMNMPLAFNEMIWSNRPVDELVCPIHLDAQETEHDLTRTARQIVVIMPCLLVYGSTKDIVEDVRKLLSAREELFTTA